MRSPFEARVHGGLDARELAALGLAARTIADFSVNLNPYGPCAEVVAAAQAARLDAYPDPQAEAARVAWARVLDTAAEQLAVGHGAADLFWAIARACIAPGDRVVIAEPTFSELRFAAAAAGARVERVFADAARDFRFDLEALARAARGARALYLCSPNNPTGEHLPVAQVAALARALESTLLVLDQSFLSLSDAAHEAHARLPPNVIAVRSLTKDFALPGLRIGYLIAERELVSQIERQRPTWATSAPALAAIACAARETAFVAGSWARLREDREALGRLLIEAGLSPLASAAGFQLVRVGDAARLRQQLLGHGISVRDCTSFGLPAYVRLAARPASDLAKLSAALGALAPLG